MRRGGGVNCATPTCWRIERDGFRRGGVEVQNHCKLHVGCRNLRRGGKKAAETETQDALGEHVQKDGYKRRRGGGAGTICTSLGKTGGWF